MKNILMIFIIGILLASPQIPNSVAATDTTPPSVPTNLGIRGLSTTQVNLFWAASTDNVGVTGYNVYRNGTKIAATISNSYIDSGFTPLKVYFYSVSAYDAAGNTSAMSTSITTTPTNLASGNVSSTQINLLWSAPTGYLGIAGYNVYRNGIKIATTASSTYTDSSITPSTDYIYTVSAYDSSGYASAVSPNIAAGNPMFTPTSSTSGISMLTTPLALSTQGVKYWFWPNQGSTDGWIPMNDTIENTFANLNLWPTLQGHLLANQGGFGLWAPMLWSTSNQTLINLRAQGIPVDVAEPGMTQCASGTNIANAELNGTGSFASSPQFPPFNITGKGWFVTKQGNAYTPEEIDYDEHMLSLMPYYNASILGSNIGTWALRKQLALVDPCGLYGVDPTGMYNTPPASVTNLMNDYVEYSQAINAKWPSNTPRISLEWQVTYGIATESSACIETLNSLYPDAGTFAYELSQSQNIPSCMAGTNLLGQLLQKMCPPGVTGGTCPDTVYMDIAFGEAAQNAANDQNYILATLNQNKALLKQYGVHFGINLPGGTCHIIEPLENAYTANPAPYITGVSLNSNTTSLETTVNDNTVSTVNPQCQTTALSEYNWLLNNGILDANTKIHYISWTMAPEENGTGNGPSISENTPYSFANTVNQMFPTATLTVNGSNSATVGIGYTSNFAWSSTNAVTATSTYTTDSPACGATGNGPFPWSVNTLSGSKTSNPTNACQAGHTNTITYTVTNSIGQSASSTITVKVAAPIANTFTVTGCTPSFVGGTCTVSVNWTTSYSNFSGAPMTIVNVGDLNNPAGWYKGQPIAGVSYFQAASNNVSTTFQLPAGSYSFGLMGYNSTTWVPLAMKTLQITDPSPTGTLTVTGCTASVAGGTCAVSVNWTTSYTNLNGAPMTVVNVGDLNNPAGWYGGSPVAGVSYYQAAQANVSTSFQLPKGRYYFQLMGYSQGTWVPLATSPVIQVTGP